MCVCEREREEENKQTQEEFSVYAICVTGGVGIKSGTGFKLQVGMGNYWRGGWGS